MEKKNIPLNIISTAKHKGFGAGSIDLSNITPIIIDHDQAYMDMGALHGRSRVERKIRFSMPTNEKPTGAHYYVVWVCTANQRYYGITACSMWINAEEKVGYKNLAEHVNYLDYAMKGKVIVEKLTVEAKSALKELLITRNAEWWEEASEELREALN